MLTARYPSTIYISYIEQLNMQRGNLEFNAFTIVWKKNVFEDNISNYVKHIFLHGYVLCDDLARTILILNHYEQWSMVVH